MSSSELYLHSSLWKLLSARRDVEYLTLELIGRFNAERVNCLIPETADRLAFNLATQLEMIFDLQRTHLQSLTPYRDFTSRADAARDRVVERLPYLLSLSTAKGAFAYLRNLATEYLEKSTGTQNSDVAFRRMVFIRALLSGTRMLCLHPNVLPGDRLSLSVRYRPNFELRERVLIQVCNRALENVPERHGDLYLERISKTLFPLDELSLTYVTEQCTTDFVRDPMGNYWILYDISWSIVAASIQCIATGADVTTYAFGHFADNIANLVMKPAQTVLRYSDEWIVLLLNIIEVLSPLLAADTQGNARPWKDIYEHILGDRGDQFPTFQLRRDHESRQMAALENFQVALKQRGAVLRDSDEEFPELLSRIEAVYADATATYFGHLSNLSPRSRSADALKLYIANCSSAHIIGHGPFLSGLLNAARNRGLIWENGLLTFPELERCPSCRPGENAHFTCLREILPLNKVLEIVNQKNRQLEDLRQELRLNYSLPIQQGVTATVIGDYRDPRPSSRDAPIPVEDGSSFISQSTDDRSASNRLSPSTTPPSSIVRHHSQQEQSSEPQSSGSWATKTSGMFKRLSGRNNGRSSRGIPSPSSLLSPGKSEPRPQSIDLSHLGSGRKNAVLSADCERFVFWSDKNLAVHDSEGLKTCTPPTIRSRALATTSRNLCALIGQEPGFYEIGYHTLSAGFERPDNAFESEIAQCFAMSPNDAYLAVGLKNGLVRVLDPRGKVQSRVLASNVDGSPPVAGLSFSADSTELVVSIRTGDSVIACTYLMPDATLCGHYKFPRFLREREADDQGPSSVIRCPSRNLLCVTSWTVSGVPLLYDCGARKSWQLNKKETGLEIGNRIYQAAFSESGKILLLVNDSGRIFKITIDDNHSCKARMVGTARRVVRKSHVIGQPQLVDMKISDDETYVRVVWIDSRNDNQAQVLTIHFELGPEGTGLTPTTPSSVHSARLSGVVERGRRDDVTTMYSARSMDS